MKSKLLSSVVLAGAIASGGGCDYPEPDLSNRAWLDVCRDEFGSLPEVGAREIHGRFFQCLDRNLDGIIDEVQADVSCALLSGLYICGGRVVFKDFCS